MSVFGDKITVFVDVRMFSLVGGILSDVPTA